nr:PREDICTED: cilia- and flagella-associated protein 54 [Latimeria chalumnae]|eukprot:XP_014343642.1 PREDICTED: cilia- and flagella-associated protein 54 [Latimeria chalumnae]
MLLWQKCKVFLQRVQPGATDNVRTAQQIYSCAKWVHILCLIHEVIHRCNLGEIDPIILADVGLRLAAMLETLAGPKVKSGEKSGKAEVKKEVEIITPDEIFQPTVLQKKPSEQLLAAYKVLDNTVNDMAAARAAFTFPDGTSLTDNVFLKFLNQQRHGTDAPNAGSDTSQSSLCKQTSVKSFVMDLHLELIQAQHRVAVKLLNVIDESDVMKKINKNKISKALFLMQKALAVPNKVNTASQKQLLEEAVTLIQKAQAEENKLYTLNAVDSVNKKKADVPPAPILLSRTHHSMTFKPAPFNSAEKVFWYRIFGRLATASCSKVRFNDDRLPGTGIEVPVQQECFLKVEGLEPNETYMFAVAAYSEKGKLIGSSIGETTKPILACLPLPIFTAWAYLTQIAYQVDHYPVVKKGLSVLWDHFVQSPSSPPTETWVTTLRESYVMCQKRLSPGALLQASPILLQLVLRSVLIQCDINIKENGLFCDSISSNKSIYKGQFARISECEKLFVAIELSNWLNDSSSALQAAIQCYGLLVPMIYHKMPLVPAVQILIKCLAVFQELPSSYWQKRAFNMAENTQHMIACSTYYVAKVLRFWQEYELAAAVVDAGKKLLLDMPDNATIPVQPDPTKSSHTNLITKATELDDGRQSPCTKKRSKKKAQNAADETINDNLRALEANMMKVTKHVGGISVTGHEDCTILYSLIACLPLRDAYTYVKKFKKRSRFLEFFVLLLERAVNAEKTSIALEWSTSIHIWLKKRNDVLIALKRNSERGGLEGVGWVNLNKPPIAVVEHQKREGTAASKKSRKDLSSAGKKREKDETEQKKPHARKRSPDTYRKTMNEAEKKAFNHLTDLLSNLVFERMKRRKLRQINIREMPWRCLMNILLGTVHFSMFQKKLMHHYKLLDGYILTLKRYGSLDPDTFSLHNSGTVIIGEDNNTNEACNQLVSPDLFLWKMTGHGEETAAEGSNYECTEESSRVQQSKEANRTPLQSNKHKSVLNTSILYLMDLLNDTFLYFRRAVVLAHRGGHWTLLQNACHCLWNSFNLLSIDILCAGERALTSDLINLTSWLPFYLASDAIIDMIMQLQNRWDTIKVLEPEGVFSVPSCVGDITREEGGASLTFETPLDDTNVVDLRWVCAFVFKTIETLYRIDKWEALAYIAIKFNIVTHERYAEKVTPLLVYAQRKLLERIKALGGPDAPQPHFLKALSATGEQITCRNFIRKQLYVATSSDEPINRSDAVPEDHDIYSGGKRAKQLVCVPLDVTNTLQCFRETLDKSLFYGRALRHSRKLMALFLAHIQEGSELSGRRTNHMVLSGRVGFSVGASKVQHSRPHDLSNKEFLTVHDVQNKPLPHSQVSLVISSYEKTIELLEANCQDGLRAQALHEVGNLHLYAGNKRAAFKSWCQALDAALKRTDILNTWQEIGSTFTLNTEAPLEGKPGDYSDSFFNDAGVWGCLQAAVLTAKIAQYSLASNFKQRNECCIFSAHLFKSLFRTCLSYPRADCEYASYDINEDYELQKFIPGIDLFSDKYRADVRTVVKSLGFIIHQLHRTKQNLMALPLCTLYHYFVSVICHDIRKSLAGRILKVKILTDLGFFAEAFHELCILNNKEKILSTVQKGFRITEKNVVMLEKKFDPSRSLLADENLEALEEVLNINLTPALNSLYGIHLVNDFTLAKAHFITALSATINHVPEKIKDLSYPSEVWNKDEEQAANEKEVTSFSDCQNKSENARDCATSPMSTYLLVVKDQLNLAKLKEILLSKAEDSLNFLIESSVVESDDIVSSVSAFDLELAIEARLLLANVSLQRQHAPLSAAIASSAIRILQDAIIFQPECKRPRKVPSALKQPGMKRWQRTEKKLYDVSQLPVNLEACERLDMHMWLRCRLTILNALTAQIHGVGIIKGKEHITSDCSQLITEGIKEAEAFRDIDTLAEMTFLAVLLDLHEGRPKGGIKLLLQDIIEMLEGKRFNSASTVLILVQALVQLVDLNKLQSENSTEDFSTKHYLGFLLKAQKSLNEQLVLLGEAVEHHVGNPLFVTPLGPLRNIYIPHINLLAKVKLRIGHALAEEAANKVNRDDPAQWIPALSLINTALELCKASATRELDVQAEILFQKGMIERQMAMISDYKAFAAVETLWDAIYVSRSYDQNFWLIRKSYLEIALVYFHLSNENTKEAAESPESGESEAMPRKDAKTKETIQVKQNESDEKDLNLAGMYKLQAWIAIRAATKVSNNIHACQTLTGQKSITMYHITENIYRQVPEFASMDFLMSYKDFMSGDYGFDYTKPLRSLVEIPEEAVENEKEQMEGKEGEEPTRVKPVYKENTKTLTWVHFVNYYNHLLRLNNLTVISKPWHQNVSAKNILRTSVISTVFGLRLATLHHFLKTYLPAYEEHCCVEPPPKELLHKFNKPVTSLIVFSKSYTTREPGKKLSIKKSLSATLDYGKTGDANVNSTTVCLDKELCVQWYIPALETAPAEKDPMILLFYAYNTKSVKVISVRTCKATHAFCGNKWISLAGLLTLHEKLLALKRQTEIPLQSLIESQAASDPEKLKQVTQISLSHDSEKFQKGEDLEGSIKQCYTDAKVLLFPFPEPQPTSEVFLDNSFETLHSLEKFLDPASCSSFLTPGSLFEWITSVLA